MAQVTAVVEQVFAPNKGGFYDIKLQDGTKLSTKKAELAQAAKELKGQSALLTYTESQNGQYTNRYLDKIETAGGSSSAYPPKERLIAAESAVKSAVDLIQYLPAAEQTPAGVEAVARFLHGLIYALAAEEPGEPEPLPLQDDIPF